MTSDIYIPTQSNESLGCVGILKDRKKLFPLWNRKKLVTLHS